MNASDRMLLEQMLVQCRRIEHRIGAYGIDEDSFIEEDALFDMLLMPIFQIGELANGLSGGFRESNREIPWHAIMGFRNVIAHDYGVVDPAWAWNTVCQDIPVLQAFLEDRLGG